MEQRKVQKTGGSTLIVSLPRKWVESIGLNQNDYISIMTNPDGTLTLFPGSDIKNRKKIKKFNVKSTTGASSFFRDLVGTYVSGFTDIDISSDEQIPLKIRKVIRDFATITIGMEIVEETSTGIIIKDLLDPGTMPFDRAIKRMLVVTRDMVLSAANALSGHDAELAEDTIYRDRDVDRLAWFINRQYNTLINDIRMSEKLKLVPSEAINYLLVSRSLERISDHAVKIAGEITKNTESEEFINKNYGEVNYLKESTDIFEKAVSLFLVRNVADSHKLINTVEDFLERLNTYYSEEAEKKYAVDLRIHISNVFESIKRIAQYSKDICEIAINYGLSRSEE